MLIRVHYWLSASNMFKKFFIPHIGNDFRPHILREVSILVISSIAILLFVASHSTTVWSDIFRAAVLPTVLVDETNENRIYSNVGTLTINPLLEAAAQAKANDMAARGYFSHVTPDGATPWVFIKNAGYNFSFAGENLAVGFFESSDVTRAWLNSPSHRENLLNNRFSEIGIATAQGSYQGVETTFVVQMFGRPQINTDSGQTTPIEKSEPIAPAPTVPQQVSGAETEIKKDNSAEVKEFVEENFVAIASDDEAQTPTFAPNGAPAGEQERYASRLMRLLASPRSTVNYIYLILAGLILLAVISSIFSEIGKQHPRHVLYGVVVLVVLFSLVYINQSTIFTDILVV